MLTLYRPEDHNDLDCRCHRCVHARLHGTARHTDWRVLLPECQPVLVSLPYTRLLPGRKGTISSPTRRERHSPLQLAIGRICGSPDLPRAPHVHRCSAAPGRPQWVSSQPPPRSPRVRGGGRRPTWRAPKGRTSPSPSPGPFTASGGPMRDSYPAHSTHGCSPCNTKPAPTA